MFDKRLDRSELGYKFAGRDFAHAWTAGDVVGDIAPEGQKVDHLTRVADAVTCADFFGASDLEILTAVGRLVLQHVGTHQLTEVFVGRHHVGGEILLLGHAGQCAYDVVGLEPFHLDQRDVVSFDNLLDDRHRQLDVLGSRGACSLVIFGGLMAERRTLRIEAYRDVRGILLAQQFLECVHKAENGGCVEPGLRDARHLDQGVICPEYQGIGVEQEQFFICFSCHEA